MSATNHSGLWKVLIPFVMMLLAGLACTGDEDLSSTSPISVVNCLPTDFELKGETAHTWDVSLKPETDYEIVVKPLQTEHPINQVGISVSHETDVIANLLISDIDINDGKASLNFTSPSDGQIKIYVSSMIGVFQQDLGLHQITVCEIE